MDQEVPASMYEDLSNEKDLVEKLDYFKSHVTNLENLLKPFCESDIYSELSIEEKVEYDIFLSYSLSSLYWMYLRTTGEDPFQHSVKGEVDRVQSYVAMYQKIKDRKKAPKLDKEAAKRFVKHGIGPIDTAPSAKRKVFNDSDSEEEQEQELKPELIL